jgi:hypothetical protein
MLLVPHNPLPSASFPRKASIEKRSIPSSSKTLRPSSRFLLGFLPSPHQPRLELLLSCRERAAAEGALERHESREEAEDDGADVHRLLEVSGGGHGVFDLKGEQGKMDERGRRWLKEG